MQYGMAREHKALHPYRAVREPENRYKQDAEPETALAQENWGRELPVSFEEVPPSSPLSPKTLAELDLPPRTLSEAGFHAQVVSPETSPPSPDGSSDTVQTPETADDDSLRVRPRVGARFSTGPGVGYESSFGGIEGFVPLQQTPGQNVTFLEGRLLLSTDDANLGGNLSVGHRIYSPESDRTFGGYIAYDVRDTGETVFNQIGAGIETLGEFWDARANAYIPIGDRRDRVEETFVDRSVSLLPQPTFQGNFLALGERLRQFDRRFEAALTGFDVEGGVKIIDLGETGELRGYGGLYYYDGPGTSGFVGGRIRLEATPTDTVKVGLSLQTDDNFGTNFVLSLAANFPGTRPRGINPQERVLARLGESVVRQENIVVDEQSESFTQLQTIAVTNSDDEPLVFRHVNLGVGTGNGTFENPAGTVAEALAVAKPEDIIYVQAGTNPGIPGFAIPDEVQVISTAPVQQIGNVQLPLSGSGVRPRIAGTVTLGDDNTLSGFEINGAVGAGIQGTGIENAAIRDNIISNSKTASPSNLGNGILLTNATGRLDITNNTFTGNSETAISIDGNDDRVELTIGSNAIANNFNAIRLELSGRAEATAQITNNSIANSGTVNLEIKGDAELDDLTISNNTIDSPSDQGIIFRAFDNARSTITISNNTLRNITGDGNLTGDGMNFGLNQNSRTELTITGNTIDTASDDGIDLELSDDARATVSISNNQIANANSQGFGFGNIGIEADTNGNSQLQLLMESNTIRGSAEQGISLFSGVAGGSSKLFTTVRFNTLTGNNLSGLASGGFDAQTFGTSTTCLRLDNNTSDTFALVNNGGTFQVEAGTNAGVVNPIGTTAAPPFTGCTPP
jgi:DNA-binding protein YbaB